MMRTVKDFLNKPTALIQHDTPRESMPSIVILWHICAAVWMQTWLKNSCFEN